MNIQVELLHISPIVLLGMSMEMTLSKYQPGRLWSQFMPRKHEISAPLSTSLYSAAQYPEEYFTQFNPSRPFLRWACLSVNDSTNIPDGMALLHITEGQYARFYHQSASTDNTAFQWFFEEWLPNSGMQVDARPHFEILDPDYGPHKLSGEWVYIPVSTINQ